MSPDRRPRRRRTTTDVPAVIPADAVPATPVPMPAPPAPPNDVARLLAGELSEPHALLGVARVVRGGQRRDGSGSGSGSAAQRAVVDG